MYVCCTFKNRRIRLINIHKWEYLCMYWYVSECVCVVEREESKNSVKYFNTQKKPKQAPSIDRQPTSAPAPLSTQVRSICETSSYLMFLLLCLHRSVTKNRPSMYIFVPSCRCGDVLRGGTLKFLWRMQRICLFSINITTKRKMKNDYKSLSNGNFHFSERVWEGQNRSAFAILVRHDRALRLSIAKAFSPQKYRIWQRCIRAWELWITLALCSMSLKLIRSL